MLSVWMAHRQRDRRKFGLSCALQITLAVSTKTHTLWSPEVLKNLWMCLRGGVVCILTLSRLWPFVKKKKEKNYKRPWRHICSVSVTLGNVTLATALKSTYNSPPGCSVWVPSPAVRDWITWWSLIFREACLSFKEASCEHQSFNMRPNPTSFPFVFTSVAIT